MPSHPLISALALLIAMLALGGCGSTLATLEAGPIEEDPGKRTLAQQVEDESIETKAIVNIRAADDAFDAANFLVVSYNGYVLAAGQVPTQALKDKVSDVLRKIDGVRRIYNEIEVGPNTTSTEYANDVWLTTQVKSALLIGSDTPSGRVKVVTERGIVFLMGLLTPDEADRVAATAADVGGVKRVVRLFELI